MGLDGVELLMEVEDEFGIELSEDEWDIYGDSTVGDLCRTILGKLREKGALLEPDVPARCLSSATFYVFRRGLCEELGLDPKRVRPSTPMEDLLPRAGRSRGWRALGERLGLQLPQLQRHPALTGTIAVGTLLTFIAGLTLPYLTRLPHMAIWGFLVGSIVFTVAALALTRPFAIHFPPCAGTVRGIVLLVLASNLNRITGVPHQGTTRRGLHPNEVWEMLRSIVVEQLDVAPDQVKRETRFVKELGVG